jgi:hypothetical protein
MKGLLEADLTQLPLWAAVAFAARCARRVQPFISKGWPRMPKNLVADVERAIAAAEQFAEQAAGLPDYAAAADADLAVDVATAARRFAKAEEITSYIDAAAAAAYAAAEAADLVRGAPWAQREKVYELVGRAVRGASSLVQVRDDIGRDYERLLQAAQSQGWHDQAPVPPSFFDQAA